MFDNYLLVIIKIRGEFLKRRRHEAGGIDESKRHRTGPICFVKETLFHGKTK